MNKIYQKDCESSCEYSLPDYLGDVKKILTVSASAIPSGRFVGGGEIDFSGVVSYDILYLDSESKLTGLTVTSDYDCSVPVNDESYIDTLSEACIASVAVRLTGPRKLTAKAVVTNNINLSLEDNLEYSGDVFSDENSPETLSKTVYAERCVFGTSAEREYAEEAERLNGITPDEIEILSTSGAVRITESEPSDDGVTVRGEIIITSIVRTDEQPPFAIKKVIPFEETVNFEGLKPGMQVMSDGYLTSVTAGVSEDADGSIITVNAISELYCIASENKELTVKTDAYLKNRDTCGKYEDLEYSGIVCSSSAEAKFSVEKSRAEIGCEEARDILKLVAEVRNIEKNVTSNGFVISGDAILTAVAGEVMEDGKTSYFPIKFTSPFSVNVNCNTNMPTTAKVDCTVVPIDTEVYMDLEKICVNCALKIGYRVTNSDTVQRIFECNTVGEEEYKSCLSNITVYYPEDDESLFEIAKKFHTTGAKIACDNNLTEQTFASLDAPVSISGVKKLIIR